jgi:hypothetical protein
MPKEHSHILIDNEDVTLVIAIGGVVVLFGMAAALIGVVSERFKPRETPLLPVHTARTQRHPTLRALPRSLKRA